MIVHNLLLLTVFTEVVGSIRVDCRTHLHGGRHNATAILPGTTARGAIHGRLRVSDSVELSHNVKRTRLLGAGVIGPVRPEAGF